MNRKKKCFITAPIGITGSVVRKYMDEILELAIKPAMKGYEITTPQSLCEAGIITEQIMREIAISDIMVANLTGNNPNVLYELALRQCTGKSIIMIAEMGTNLPLDLSQYRIIWYENDKEGLLALKKRLYVMVRNIELGNIHDDFSEVMNVLYTARGLSIDGERNPPIQIMKKRKLEDSISLAERTLDAKQIRLVNYAGTSFLANKTIVSCYDREWARWFKKAVEGELQLDLILTKPNTPAAEEAARYKMYPAVGGVEDKRKIISGNYEGIQELVHNLPKLRVMARFTDIALPYSLHETIFQEKSKNHIKVDLCSPLTGDDGQKPSFIVYNSENPELYEHFSTVITRIIEVSEEVVNTTFGCKETK